MHHIFNKLRIGIYRYVMFCIKCLGYEGWAVSHCSCTTTPIHQKPPEPTEYHEGLRYRCFSQHWLLCRTKASEYVFTVNPRLHNGLTIWFLDQGATVTFLLRNVACFDKDETIQPYIVSGHARLVQGDALKEADVQKAWAASAEGSEHGIPDVVLFSVGGTPKFTITGGAIIDPPDLCTRAMLALMPCFSKDASTQPQPKLILISSTGLSKSAHNALPLAMKPMYAYLLRSPHKDKLGMERVVHYAAHGWVWPKEDGEPLVTILPPGWKSKLDGERAEDGGFLTDVVVVRPSMLTDGDCKADKKGDKAYRAEEKEVASGYTVSRRDVAHFIVEKCLPQWEKWNGKCVRVAY